MAIQPALWQLRDTPLGGHTQRAGGETKDELPLNCYLQQGSQFGPVENLGKSVRDVWTDLGRTLSLHLTEFEGRAFRLVSTSKTASSHRCVNFGTSGQQCRRLCLPEFDLSLLAGPWLLPRSCIGLFHAHHTTHAYIRPLEPSPVPDLPKNTCLVSFLPHTYFRATFYQSCFV